MYKNEQNRSKIGIFILYRILLILICCIECTLNELVGAHCVLELTFNNSSDLFSITKLTFIFVRRPTVSVNSNDNNTYTTVMVS